MLGFETTIVPQSVTAKSESDRSLRKSSASKPSAFIRKSLAISSYSPAIATDSARPSTPVCAKRIFCTRTPCKSSALSSKIEDGLRKKRKTTPSSSAFATSRREPGIELRSRRYRHNTDFAPCRCAVRTQSIAVSPPPKTTTLRPRADNSLRCRAESSSPK